MRLLLAAILATLTALASPARAEWRRAESPHFVVYSQENEGRLRAYVQRLEVFDELLRRRHGIAATEGRGSKLSVYVVEWARDFRRVRSDLPQGVTGFYSASAREIAAYADPRRGDDSVLLHEYVHHFMAQHRPYAYPAWAVEGLAEYYRTADIESDSIQVGRPAQNQAYALQRQAWLPLDVVLSRRPQQLTERRTVSAFYAQAWLLTHYFLSDPERYKRLNAYVLAVGERGADPARAMEEATGQSNVELERSLRDYFRGKLRFEEYRGGLEGYAAPTVTVTRLPASADDLLLENQALKHGVSAKDAPALAITVRARAAKHPNDRLAEMTLARAELAAGNDAAAEALLQKRLAADPNDVEALELSAYKRLAEAEKAPARATASKRDAAGYLGRAYKLDPQRRQTLLGLALLREGAKDWPNDNDLETLLAAHEAAPQVDFIRLKAAQALMARKSYKAAIRMLKPVANNPHGDAESEAAQALLKVAAAGDGAAQAAP